MAKATSKSALKTRLQALDTELEELQNSATELGGTSPQTQGWARALKEMRKTFQRAKEQGEIAKL